MAPVNHPLVGAGVTRALPLSTPALSELLSLVDSHSGSTLAACGMDVAPGWEFNGLSISGRNLSFAIDR